MSTPSATPTTNKPCPFERYIKPYLNPYYLTVGAVLGAITTIFGGLTALLIIIVANFNILGWIE